MLEITLTRNTSIQIKNSTLLIWIISLAALAVGARNFEEGLKVDGLLYAAIADQIARSGEWFFLWARTPDFKPFAEHPHLGLWTLAATLKIFPAADWAIRIPGHLYYVANLFLTYFLVKKFSGVKEAVFAVLALWSWDVFAQFHSDAYLDPGFVFWGYFSIYLLSEKKLWPAALSFSVCLLQKGFAAVGFVPVIFFLLVKDFKKFRAKDFFYATLAFCLPLFAYFLAIKNSSVPNFLDIYWERQFSSRFGKTRSIQGLWLSDFLPTLFKNTHYLIFCLPLLLGKKDRFSEKNYLPLLLSLSFIVLFASNYRVGYQYWLPIMPPLAWLIGNALGAWLVKKPAQWLQVTTIFCIGAVFLLQYTPITLKKRGSPEEIQSILQLTKSHPIKKLILEGETDPHHFYEPASYAWYTKLEILKIIDKRNDIPDIKGSADTLFLLKRPPHDELIRNFAAENWCLKETFPHSTLWAACK